ncbi:MAG TPA: DUF4175 family protein [Tepidisphaeraceae bacterium]|nr:DUF4175 family protein [Tepidisphaeraceae bacterium]
MTQIALLNSLAGVRRRVRLLSAVHGLGLLLAATIAALLALVLLDYLFNFPPGLRILLLIFAAIGICVLAVRRLALPLAARLGVSDIAGRIEQAFPVFEDRLRSTIEFTSRPTDGSEAMKRRVADQTSELAEKMNIAAVVQPRPAIRAMSLALAAMAICAILAISVGPDYLHAALSRLLTPLAGTAWPKTTQIALANPLPIRIAAGTPLEVRIRLVKGDRPSAKAVVSYQYRAGGPLMKQVMTRNSDGTYSANIDSRLDPGQSMATLIIATRSGDDNRQWTPVQVVPPLTIKQVLAIVSPPSYATGTPITTADLSAAPATVTIGSPIELRISFSKPLAEIPIRLAAIDSPLPAIRWDVLSPGSSTAVGHFIARAPAHFNILATDRDGLSNSGIEDFQILVRPDQLPSIQFEKPLRNQECTPDATIAIQALADDDFGVKNVELAARRLGDNQSWADALVTNFQPTNGVAWTHLDSTGDRVRFRLNWDWELASLADGPLKPGDEIDFYLRVQDNYLDENGRPRNPAYVDGGHLRLSIISQQQLSQEITEELSRLRANVDDTRKANEGLRSGTKTLQDDTHKKPALDRADRAMAAQLANDQSGAASQTKQIADKLGEMLDRMAQNKMTDADMAANIAEAQRLLNNAAENPMKDAASQLSNLADPQRNDDAATRNQALDQAQQNQAAASAQLQAAMQKMGDQTGVNEFLKQVSELLDAQRNLSARSRQAGQATLGKTADQLTDDQRKNLNDLAKQQQDLARQTDAAMQQMNKAADQQAQSNPSDSQALKQAAQTGQQQNVSGQMQQAAQAMQQNQQADSQSGQQQAELGLMMMERQLREAANRHLMELVRQLETAQQLVADLLQQQAGHNLDNLFLQGKSAVAAAIKADPELITDMFLYSQRDPKNLQPPPELETQIALQEQTERNTRNIVTTVQQLPEGADPAAQLTRAAQRMSRAISYLQDARLADAYQPPQTEALAALIAAKDAIDKQADAARQKMQDQQRESLRQQFVQARDAQVKLNTRTVAIDKTPRAPDGQLDHRARANIGILSDDQSNLAKNTAKLDDDLASIGSIAYAYANDDIVKKMQTVSQRLTALDPGAATRKTQDRIVLELNDMIKDLSIKPKQSQFSNTRNNNGGGGQQGQSGPRLPTEAEIRLVQDMQRILNQDTKDADAAGAAANDKASVVDLGARQSDLRKLLDGLLQKASDGQTSLGPEPANKQSLPEEAKDEDLDLQELKDAALNAKPDAESIGDGTQMLGIRMGRAHQRLSIDVDPGETTQRIQERIVIEMDALAKMAQEQQEQARPSSSPGRPQRPGEQPGQQQQTPGNAVANGQRAQPGATPAPNDRRQGPPLENVDISATINELKDSWGRLSPRQRAAVMEGSTDQTIEKFKDFVDGYYRTLAAKTQQNSAQPNGE